MDEAFNDPNGLDSIPQDRPVHTAYVLNMNHHFYLTTAFRALNTGLCLISKDNHEEWVNFIAQHIGINAVPAMIIDKDGGETISQIYIGSGEIGKQLFEHLETKK